ncbi:MAG: c-type cytochrome biogenesis protein [Candidatus Ozemobacter sibiricus]|jgi:cytochrome c biogenesis protein CcdA|uniref:C-type cytochrome biogenesis protein n=1 Tax=Candidatus Ozemobacter sibiricus TaxID=2268124 RepID=A0A367ZSX5_9BACT|nr:MAG: c-type cytochrome biogenesis protein [Candidatus Ozemobacter sibiricus]
MDFGALEQSLAELIATSAWLAPLAAFVGGALTALNPCVLATVPLIIGVVGGYAPGEGAWKRAAGFSFFFVVGFALELAVLFSVSAAVAPYLTGPSWRYVIAAICFFLGLHLLLEFQIPAVVSLPAGKWGGIAGVTMLGFLFGLVSMPCSGPVLMLLASLVPELGVPRAGTLLFFYGVGHSILILIAGISVGTVQALADARGMHRAVRVVKKIAAVLILGVGLYFLRS